MRTSTPTVNSANLPAISNCWKAKDCDGSSADVKLERVEPRADSRTTTSSKPLFGNNPFESFENAFQSISF